MYRAVGSASAKGVGSSDARRQFIPAVKNAVSFDARELTLVSKADELEITLFRSPLDFGRYEEGVDECAATG